jgi:hypothetical protein
MSECKGGGDSGCAGEIAGLIFLIWFFFFNGCELSSDMKDVKERLHKIERKLDE